MSFSNYLEEDVLDYVLTQVPFWLGASTADPGEDAAGLAEPVGNGYARVSSSAWARSGSAIANTAEVALAAATGSWGTLTYGCLFDAETGGNMLLSLELDASLAIGDGEVFKFAIGAFNITLD